MGSTCELRLSRITWQESYQAAFQYLALAVTTNMLVIWQDSVYSTDPSVLRGLGTESGYGQDQRP